MTPKERLELTRSDPDYIQFRIDQAQRDKLNEITDQLQAICDKLNDFRDRYGRAPIDAKISLHSPIKMEPYGGAKPLRYYVDKSHISIGNIDR